MNDEIDVPVPAGFEAAPMGGSFISANGPFYVRCQGPAVTLGLRIERRHCNAMGNCHGGLLAAFAETLFPVTMSHHPEIAALRRFVPTVSLQLDYLGPVYRGDWLEGDGEVLKLTRSLVFVQGLLRVEGQVVLRASGVFKFGRAIDPDTPGLLVRGIPAGPSKTALTGRASIGAVDASLEQAFRA